MHKTLIIYDQLNWEQVLAGITFPLKAGCTKGFENLRLIETDVFVLKIKATT